MADVTWTAQEVDCVTGGVIQTETGETPGDGVGSLPFSTTVQEKVQARAKIDFGDLEGWLSEFVYADSTAYLKWQDILSANAMALDGYEATGPGFADILMREVVYARMTTRTARVLADIYAFLAERVDATDGVIGLAPGEEMLKEYVITGEGLASVTLHHLAEAMMSASSVTVNAWTVKPADGVSVLDSVVTLYLKELAEQAAVTDTVDSWYTLNELAYAISHVARLKSESIEEQAQVIDAMFRVVADLLGEAATAEEAMWLGRLNRLMDSVTAGSGLVLMFPKLLEEEVIVDGEWHFSTIYKLLLDEGVNVSLWLRDVNGVAVFCVNPRLKGVTTYDGWDFNSYAQDKRGDVWAANGEGVWKITEKPEQAVRSKVKFAKMGFGTEALKAMEQVYLGLSTDGDLVFTYTNDEGTTAVYRVKPLQGLKTTRVKLGKGSIGRWFEFELEDVDATELDIDEVSLVPLPYSRVMR